MVKLVSILKSRRFRWAIRILAIVVILLGVAAVLFPGRVLTVDSGSVQADVIVVLGGAPHDRAERAADLFKEGAAPRVLISGIGDDRRNKRILLQAGVPAEAIQVESESFTTRENAQFTIPMLRALGAKRVIIVTSWFHSRRALRTFRHYARDIQFFSRPSYYGYPGQVPDDALNSIAAYKQSHLPAVPAVPISNFLSAPTGDYQRLGIDGRNSPSRRPDGPSAREQASHWNKGEVSIRPNSDIGHRSAAAATGPIGSASNVSHSASQPFSISNQIISKTDWRYVRGEVKSEYIKLIGYWVYYGVCPF